MKIRTCYLNKDKDGNKYSSYVEAPQGDNSHFKMFDVDLQNNEMLIVSVNGKTLSVSHEMNGDLVIGNELATDWENYILTDDGFRRLKYEEYDNY